MTLGSLCGFVCLIGAYAQAQSDATTPANGADPSGATTQPVQETVGTQPSAESAPLSLSTPERRGPPSPFASPPFPFSEFLGPTIGLPDSSNDWGLMQALYKLPGGDAIKASRVRAYGWISPGLNLSTSHDSNAPAAYCLRPDKVDLDQAVFVFERLPDTVQTDHIDWGYHLLALYGTDYRYMIAKGLWSNQLLKRNELYGYDIPEFDLRWYFPQVAEGMTFKIGRWISTPDIEACPTPVNYMFTHSIMFSIDPYTYFGAMADIRLNKNWTVELGLLGSNDVAPWDPSCRPNGHLMVKWVSNDNKDSIWGGINLLGEGKWRDDHDDLQHIVATWTHKFSDKFHMSTEAYYMWQRDAFLGGTINFGPVKRFGSGGGYGWYQPGLSDSWGLVNNLEYKVTDKDYVTLRNDVFRDDEGQRTGLRNTYSSHCLGWSHNVNDWITIRPELRYEKAYNLPAYDNGLHSGEFMLAMDVIIRF